VRNSSPRMKALALAVLVLLAGYPGLSHAAGSRAGGTGLYLTQSAETLAPGAFRIGAYGSYVRYVVSEDPETWDFSPEMAWAPARDLEAMFAMPLLRYQVSPDGKETGVGDGVVGLKYRLFPHVAALGYVSIPFGDESRSMGTGGTDVGFAGIFSFPLGGGVVADLNAGYQFSGVTGTDGDDFVFYGLGVSVPVGARTKIFGEFAGRTVWQGQTHDSNQFDLGLRHQVSERMTVTVGGGRGISGDWGREDPELRVFAGFEFLFGAASAAVAPVAPAPVAVAPKAAAPAAVPAAPAPAAVAPLAEAPVVVAAPVAPVPVAPAPAAPVPAAPVQAVAAPVVAAAPAHTAQELDAAKKRLAAAEILFEYDRTRLTPEGARALKQITEDMAKFSEINFVIEGHADSRGTSSYNKILGLRRAETVMRAMVKAGVAFERLKVVTQGEMKPKVPNKDARGMALNRRVVFSAL